MKMATLLFSFAILIFNCKATDNLSTLAALYPDQSKEFIKIRVKNSKNLHKFYRSFVRYYYSILKKNPSFFTELSELKNYVGIVAGDPHIENFGFLVDKNHKAFFSLNDFDDADKNIILFDVLRHLTSSLMVKSDLKVDHYLENYQAGLAGQNYEFNSELTKLKEKSQSKGHRLTDNDIDFDKNIFLKYKPVILDMTQAKKEETQRRLQVVLQTQIDQTLKIADFYKRTKDNGGSAGLERYELLVMVKNKLHWLELKELTTEAPAYYSKSNKNLKRLAGERVDLIRDHFLSSTLAPEFDLIVFQGKNYLARFIWDGELGIDFNNMPENAWNEIIYTEARLLGHLHSRDFTKEKLTNYRDAISGLPPESWKSVVKKITKKMDETYSAVKD